MTEQQLLRELAALAPTAERATDPDERLEARDWCEEITQELAALRGLEREVDAGPILRWPLEWIV